MVPAGSRPWDSGQHRCGSVCRELTFRGNAQPFTATPIALCFVRKTTPRLTLREGRKEFESHKNILKQLFSSLSALASLPSAPCPPPTTAFQRKRCSGQEDGGAPAVAQGLGRSLQPANEAANSLYRLDATVDEGAAGRPEVQEGQAGRSGQSGLATGTENRREMNRVKRGRDKEVKAVKAGGQRSDGREVRSGRVGV